MFFAFFILFRELPSLFANTVSQSLSLLVFLVIVISSSIHYQAKARKWIMFTKTVEAITFPLRLKSTHCWMLTTFYGHW